MTKLALCVGINEYPGTDSDLSGCVNDANDWGKLLSDYGFEVDKLLDEDATKEGIAEGLQRLIAHAESGDTVVFTYSGHGSWVPDTNNDDSDGRDEVLCPYDIAKNRPLIDDDLNKIFNQAADGVKIIMISDSCHSGTVYRMQSSEGVSKIRFLPPEHFLQGAKFDKAVDLFNQNASFKERGSKDVLLLSGCQDNQVSYDGEFDEKPNGVFTHFALKALKKIAKDATYDTWHRAIRKLLPNLTYPQNPNLEGPARLRNMDIFGRNGKKPLPSKKDTTLTREELLEVLENAKPGQDLRLDPDMVTPQMIDKMLSKKVQPKIRGDIIDLGEHVDATVHWWGVRVEFDAEAVQKYKDALSLENLLLVGVPAPVAGIVWGVFRMIDALGHDNGVIVFVTWAGVHWYLPR